jgi:chromosome segregation ATPase
VEAVKARLEELTAAQAALQEEQAKLVESQSKANLRAMASKRYGLAFSQGTGDLDELWDVVNRLTASVDLLEGERGQQLGVLNAIREEVAATAAAAAAATANASSSTTAAATGTKTPPRSRSPAVAPGAEEECVGEESTLAEDVSVLSLQLRALTASVESLLQQHQREAAEAAAAEEEEHAHAHAHADEDAAAEVCAAAAAPLPAAAAVTVSELTQRLAAMEEVQSEVSQLKQGSQQLAAQLASWVGKAAAAGADVAKLHLVSSTLADQLDALQHQVAGMATASSGGSADAATEALQQAQAAHGDQIRDLVTQVSVLEGLVRQASPLVNLAEEVTHLQVEHRDLATLVGRLQQQQQGAVAAMGATLQQLQEQQGSLVQGLGSLQAAQEQLAAEVTSVTRVSPGVVTPGELALAPVAVSSASGVQAAGLAAGDGELTFDDLAGAPSPSMRIMAQRVVMSVAEETLSAAAAAAPGSPTALPQGSVAGKGAAPTSSSSSAAGEATREAGTAMTPTSTSGSSGSSSSELLGAELGLMSPAHQTAFLHKLLQVVEAHAGRLVRQYATHPELAEQLTQVGAGTCIGVVLGEEKESFVLVRGKEGGRAWCLV